MKKRIASLLLILCMAVTLLPTAAFAEEATGTSTEGSEEQHLTEPGTSSTGGTIYVDAKNGNDTQEGVGTTAEKAYKTVEKAVAAAASGNTIQLGEGNYTLYKVNSVGHTKGKDLTFVGQGADKTGWNIGAEVPDPANFGTEYNGDYSFDGAGTVTFKNMTLRSGSADYLGFIRADNTVVEDCIINGKTFYWGYKSAIFKNTTFNCPIKDYGFFTVGDYALWTYSSPVMTFEKCTFNSSGKVINVYTDFGAGKNDITVNFKDCTVVNNGASLKPVLNINDSNMGNYKYILNISGNNTVTGVDVDRDTCSRLFGFGGKADTNNKGKTVVNFGNTPVWKDGKMVDAKAYHNEGIKVDGVSYNNGVADANDSLYAEGYKDNAFTITPLGEWINNGDGTESRKVTKTCNYCGYSEEVEETKELFPVNLMIYRNGNTETAYKTVPLESQPKGTVIDLSTLNIGDYYTANYTGDYDFYGWYNDGSWNNYKANPDNPPAGLKEITVNGWTNLKCMVYDYEKVVYFQSAADLAAYQEDHSKTDGLLSTTTARFGSTLPTADAPTPERTGYTFKFWSREGQTGDVTGQTVNGWTNLYANWEKKSYTVVAKLYVNGEPAYYQNRDFYTYQVSGLYGDLIDYSEIEAKAIAQAEKLHGAAASYTAELYDDGKTTVCTKFGEDQPNESTHYVNINIKTTEHVYVYRMFDGEMESTEYHHTTAPFGAKVNEYLNANVTNLDVPGYTHEEWFNKDVPALDAKFGENDTIHGWTNVVIKYTKSEYPVTYRYESSDPSVPVPYQVTATLPTNDYTYAPGELVRVAMMPETVEIGKYVWTFKTWSVNGVDVVPNSQVEMTEGGLTVVGIWERTEKEYGVTYQYANSVPTEVWATLPTNADTYTVGQKVTTARPNPDVVDVNGYRWTFKTWQLNGIDVASNTQVPMVEGGLTFVGVWERTELPPAEYGVTYKYDNSVPEEVKATLPTNPYTYAVDEKVTTARPNPDVVDVNGYRWTFKTWQLNGIDVASNTQVPMVKDGLTFVGVWESERIRYVLTINYVDKSGKELAASHVESLAKDAVYNVTSPSIRNYTTDQKVVEGTMPGHDFTIDVVYTLNPVRYPSTPSKPTLNTGDHFAYVMGYPDGTVRPNGSITRAEVSTILFRLLSDKTRDEYFTTESSFTDVKAGAWYNNSIATLEKAGAIVDTAKGGAFRPNEAITRAELAAMLAQFADAKPVKGMKFSDVSADHWAYDAIAIAAKMGWIEGYPDGTFRPDATITRAEMMTLVNRALERVPSDEDHLLSKRAMLTFPDCTTRDWFYIAVQEATNSHSYERAATEKNGDEQWTALRDNRDWTKFEQ